MDKERISTWIKTLQGKSRWELKYESSDLYLSDNLIIAADVYDDYLIFRKLDNTLRAKDLFQVEIETFNDWGSYYAADRIINAI